MKTSTTLVIELAQRNYLQAGSLDWIAVIVMENKVSHMIQYGLIHVNNNLISSEELCRLRKYILMLLKFLSFIIFHILHTVMSE